MTPYDQMLGEVQDLANEVRELSDALTIARARIAELEGPPVAVPVWEPINCAAPSNLELSLRAENKMLQEQLDKERARWMRFSDLLRKESEGTS